MRRESGFTLIELVVVIVILGILAAFAVPRFMGVQKEARISTLQGLKGSIQGAASLTHAKAMASGNTTIPSSDVVGSFEDIDTVGGLSEGVFPAANETGIIRALQDTSGFQTTDSDTITVANIFNGKAYDVAASGDGEDIVFYPDSMEEMTDGDEYECAVLYAVNSTDYAVNATFDGC